MSLCIISDKTKIKNIEEIDFKGQIITYGFGSDGTQKEIVMSHKNLFDGASCLKLLGVKRE